MRLEAIKIKRFRSIEDNEVSKCGDFNILIGKNNSGKSTILSAINIFFSCINEEHIVTLEPPIGKQYDFFNNVAEKPIQITLTLSLNLSERDILVQDIATEVPQMRHSIEGIDASLHLSVTINVININTPRAYVSKITINNPTNHSSQSERTIVYISIEAALEMFEKIYVQNKRIKDEDQLRKLINRLDEEAWDRYVVKEARPRTPISSQLIRFTDESLSEDILQKIDNMVGGRSYTELSKVLETLRRDLASEIDHKQEFLKRNSIVTFTGEETSIPNYVMNILKRLSDIKVLYLTEQRKQIGKEEAERLLSLKVQRGGTKVLQNIQEVVGSLLGVQVDAFQGAAPLSPKRRLPLSYRSETQAELDIDNFLVEVNGSGIREALRLILDYEFKQPDILLVEEPEIHLHPALEISMMRYLKQISDKCQVFITTHSTNFLDTAEMKNVYLISKPANSTKIQLIDFEDAEAQIPTELGIRLSSLFMFDRLVFVEGLSDAAVIREWASTLKINLSKSSIGFIPMGGARNFAHFAAESTLSFLTKRRVKIWFLLDKDERNDSEIQKLEKSLVGRANLKVLNKREIENYLLCPRAIAEFIKLKKDFSKKGEEVNLTEEDIRKSIEECVERFKQTAIDKRVARLACRSIHPSIPWNFRDLEISPMKEEIIEENQKMIRQIEDRIKNIENFYEEAKKSISNMWEAKKLDLVPGDHLIDEVCKKYGVRFKKEADASRLASLMKENEINKEIVEIIKEIGS